MRIGSVPYLNVKPLVDWFHTDEAPSEAEIVYAVPSALARMLRSGEIDVANCSIFEALQEPGLVIVPNISISADGEVKSVRLFCRKPIEQLKTVALDTSSLTSSALTRILLREMFGAAPEYVHCRPDLNAMLAEYDAGLIIGDLKLFDVEPGVATYDLGLLWKQHTGLPFVYAAWQARTDSISRELVEALTAAKEWGMPRREQLAAHWAGEMALPESLCREYLLQIMDYDLRPDQQKGLALFQERCFAHNLVQQRQPICLFEP